MLFCLLLYMVLFCLGPIFSSNQMLAPRFGCHPSVLEHPENNRGIQFPAITVVVANGDSCAGLYYSSTISPLQAKFKFFCMGLSVQNCAIEMFSFVVPQLPLPCKNTTMLVSKGFVSKNIREYCIWAYLLVPFFFTSFSPDKTFLMN